MYYPYFRGKQYELITIRENAKLLSDSGFVPIIEPVKVRTNSLELAINKIEDADGECILIINPQCGDHCVNDKAIKGVLDRSFKGVSAGILLNSSMTIDGIGALCKEHARRNVTLIHNGFDKGKSLAAILVDHSNVTRHVFTEDMCGKLYRKNFIGEHRILLKDGFHKRTNKDHPDRELFSDLYATFDDEENMNGFGDYLIVGDDYSESGGPAYAVAIHLTYIDNTEDGAMYIHHFKSDRMDTPTDPAGKFGEALAKLVAEVNKPNSMIMKSKAVKEFIAFHNNPHFPGLGYVKKLSMQHHIETLADYFSKKR